MKIQLLQNLSKVNYVSPSPFRSFKSSNLPDLWLWAMVLCLKHFKLLIVNECFSEVKKSDRDPNRG